LTLDEEIKKHESTKSTIRLLDEQLKKQKSKLEQALKDSSGFLATIE
jgi:hypothetical protein